MHARDSPHATTTKSRTREILNRLASLDLLRSPPPRAAHASQARIRSPLAHAQRLPLPRVHALLPQARIHLREPGPMATDVRLLAAAQKKSGGAGAAAGGAGGDALRAVAAAGPAAAAAARVHRPPPTARRYGAAEHRGAHVARRRRAPRRGKTGAQAGTRARGNGARASAPRARVSATRLRLLRFLAAVARDCSRTCLTRADALYKK